MMGTREKLLGWFSQLNSAERQAVVPLLSMAERKQLESLLQALPAAEQIRLDKAERAQFERVRRQLHGAPSLFQQILAGNEVTAPPGLQDAVRAEIDGLRQVPSAASSVPSGHGQPWFEIDLEILKRLWLRFLKTCKFK